MRIIVDIGHPAHVHFFKHFITEMRERGHDIMITASQKDVTLELLKAYGLDYVFSCKRYRGLGLAYELVKRDAQMFFLAKKFKPDVITGILNTIAAHVSRLTRAKSIIFTDDPPNVARLASSITLPFSDVICTPSSLSQDLGKKHIRYNGFKELAYLHPHYFKPDPTVLQKMGLREGEKFIVVRFVAWQASHDVGRFGISLSTKQKLVETLSKHAKVLITSERPLPEELEKHHITLPPEKIHDLLYYAYLLVGDTQTMTTEAAVLGTPAVRCNSFVGPHDMGNFIELEKKYGLIYSFREPEHALNKALELIQQPDLKEQWAKKRQVLLADKIDVTQFMVDLIENYPESFNKYKKGKQRYS